MCTGKERRENEDKRFFFCGSFSDPLFPPPNLSGQDESVY